MCIICVFIIKYISLGFPWFVAKDFLTSEWKQSTYKTNKNGCLIKAWGESAGAGEKKFVFYGVLSEGDIGNW